MRKHRFVAVVALVTATLGTATAAEAQAWGPPPPPPPYGFGPPPPPPSPPPPPHVVGRAYWSGWGYGPPHRHCWTEYRHHGWERVRVCR